MTSPTPAPTNSDVGASFVRTFVMTGVGAVLAYLAKRWHIVLDDGSSVGLQTSVTALFIAGYYTVVRLLEAKWKGFGWFLGLAKQPKYVDASVVGARITNDRFHD